MPERNYVGRPLGFTAKMMRRPKCARCSRRIWTETYLDIGGHQYCHTCADYCTRNTAQDFDMEDFDT